MKKAFVYRFAEIIFTCIITSIAYGQSLNRLEKFRKEPVPENIIPLSKQLYLNKDSDFIFRNEINTKAVRNFIREYKNVADAKWFESNSGFTVHCTMNGFKTKVFYDKKGNYERMIRSYAEAQLPHEVRHLVKRNFYDFSIYQVYEIRIKDDTIYIVTIEDKTCRKKIKVMNGEIEILYQYPKS